MIAYDTSFALGFRAASVSQKAANGYSAYCLSVDINFLDASIGQHLVQLRDSLSPAAVSAE